MIIDLSVEIPALPADWQGSTDDLLQFLAANGVFHLEGNLPAAQIGGSRPTADVGIWYGDDSIERYLNGKYRPVSDVPIGAVFMFAGIGAVAPPNYFFCTGQSLARADYPELFSVIGVTYNATDTPETDFKVPDYRGRVPVGAGVGDYAPQGITGKMREVVAGAYSGLEWLRNLTKAAGAPSVTKNVMGTAIYPVSTTALSETFPPRVGQQFLIRYR